MSTFPEQLIAARKAAHMTQEQLADAVHVARNTISSWEHGRTQPDIETLRCLGQVLHVDFSKDPDAPQTSGSAQEQEAASSGEKACTEKDADPAPGPSAAGRPSVSKRTRLLVIAAAAVVVCACLLLFLPKVMMRAAVDVHPLETPVKMMQNTDIFENDGRGWMFTFEITNTGSVPFRPESANVVFYADKRIDSQLQMSYDDMRPWMVNDTLNKGDTPLQLLFGTNHTSCTHAVCIIRGTDQNGHALEFSGTVEFSQEMQP